MHVHPAPAGRRLLRPAGTARRLGAGRARAGRRRARAGNVLVANALGSGVLESPGAAGLPAGDLRAAAGRGAGSCPRSPPGGAASRRRSTTCCEQLRRAGHQAGLSRRSAWTRCSAATSTRRGARRAGRAHARRARTPTSPRSWSRLSQAPVWQRARAAGWSARPVGLRVFAVADARRLLGDAGRADARGQQRRLRASCRCSAAARSKDTWVLARRRRSASSRVLGRPLGVRDVVRSGADLPSRRGREPVLARPLRRALRRQRAPAARRAGARSSDDDDDPPALSAALDAGAARSACCPRPGRGRACRPRGATAARGARHASSRPACASPCSSCSGRPRTCAARCRVEHWQALIEPAAEAAGAARGRHADAGELLAFLDRVLMSLVALSGFALDDMTRDDGWRFLMIGRRIERLQFLAESIAGFLAAWRTDRSAQAWLLELADSSITYRTALPRGAGAGAGARPAGARRTATRMPCCSSCARCSARWPASASASSWRPSPTCGRWMPAWPPGIWGGWSTTRSPLPAIREARASWPGACRPSPAAAGQLSDQLGLRFFMHVDVSQQTPVAVSSAVVMNSARYRMSCTRPATTTSRRCRCSQQLAHLSPRESPLATLCSPRAGDQPRPTRRRDGLDAFGNPLTRLGLRAPARRTRGRAPACRSRCCHGRCCGWPTRRPGSSCAGAQLFRPAASAAAELDAARFRFESPLCAHQARPSRLRRRLLRPRSAAARGGAAR